MKYHPDHLCIDSLNYEALKNRRAAQFVEIHNSYEFLMKNFALKDYTKEEDNKTDTTGSETKPASGAASDATKNDEIIRL